jgi:hypothetical protein
MSVSVSKKAKTSPSRGYTIVCRIESVTENDSGQVILQTCEPIKTFKGSLNMETAKTGTVIVLNKNTEIHPKKNVSPVIDLLEGGGEYKINI